MPGARKRWQHPPRPFLFAEGREKAWKMEGEEREAVNIPNISRELATALQEVEQLLEKTLASSSVLVEQIARYITHSGGKRLRPLLVLMSGRACRRCTEEHIRLAAAIEFLHTATLLHDDVVDASHMRRHQPSANARWDNARSVLSGDFLYARAFELLVRIGNLDLVRLLSATAATLAEGEMEQLRCAGSTATTEEEYLGIIAAKTAALFQASTLGGGMLSGAGAAHLEMLQNYGRCIGVAFQLMDDLLDYRGDPEEMGKRVGDDLAGGKLTLPVIYALGRLGDSEAQRIRALIRERDRSQVAALCTLLEDCGALEYTALQARDYSAAACRALEALPPSPGKQELLALAQTAYQRRA